MPKRFLLLAQQSEERYDNNGDVLIDNTLQLLQSFHSLPEECTRNSIQHTYQNMPLGWHTFLWAVSLGQEEE